MRKTISNIILGVLNGLVQKYFWNIKACPYKYTSVKGLTWFKSGTGAKVTTARPALTGGQVCPPAPQLPV